jgi:hypothetical protein
MYNPIAIVLTALREALIGGAEWHTLGVAKWIAS